MRNIKQTIRGRRILALPASLLDPPGSGRVGQRKEMAGIGLDWMGNPAAPPPATAESEEGEPAEEVEPSASAPPTIAQIAEEHEERPAEETSETAADPDPRSPVPVSIAPGDVREPDADAEPAAEKAPAEKTAPAPAPAPPAPPKPRKVVPFVQLDLNPDIDDASDEFEEVSGSERGSDSEDSF